MDEPTVELDASSPHRPGPLPQMSVAGSPPTATAGPATWPQIDGYRILGFIGGGGMGDVFRAVQLSTRREVALKLMRGGFASEKARARFDREVELTARLDHPHIAGVFDSGVHHGVYFYAMELIANGQPLDEYAAKGRLAVRKVLELFHKVCQAVAHAHQRGVIHRDLKPSNILADAAGQPHVLDFGLAKALADRDRDAQVSIDGDVSGTPAYMSPEQAAGEAGRLDTRTDVYSLGVILYKLLCGTFPHDVDGHVADVMRRISQEEPTRPRRANKELDAELEAMLLKALAKGPDARYASAGELARDVENYLSGEPLAARKPTTLYFLRKRVWKRRVPVSIAAGVLLAFGAVAVYSYVRIINESRQREAARHSAVISSGNLNKALGDARAERGVYDEAVTLYEEAIKVLAAEGAPTRAAELGLWNAYRSSPPPLNMIAGPKGGVLAIAVSGDGRTALTGSADGNVRVWDLPTGRQLHSLAGHAGPVMCVALSPDGATALTGGVDGKTLMWDLRASLPTPQALPGPAGPVKRVGISPTGTTGVSVSGDAFASKDDALTIWDLRSGLPLRDDLKAAGTVTTATFSPDGTELLTAGTELASWDIKSGRKGRSPRAALVTAAMTIPKTAPTTVPTIIPTIAAGSLNASEEKGDVDVSRTTVIAYSRDGRRIVSGEADGTLRIWTQEMSERAPELTVRTGGSAALCVAFGQGEQTLVGFFEDGTAGAWDLSSGTRVFAFGNRTRTAAAAAVSGDRRFAVCASGDDTLTVWRLDEPIEARTLAPADGPVANLYPLAGGRAVTGLDSQGIAFWDIATGRRLHPSPSPQGKFGGFAASHDGRRIAVADAEGVSIFGAGTPGPVRKVPIKRRADVATPLALSPNGKVLVVPTLENTIAVVDVDAGRVVRQLGGHRGAITSLAFSGDGGRVVSGSRDQTVRLWDVSVGTELRAMLGHLDAVEAVAYAPDGKTIASAGGRGPLDGGKDDFAVRIWDTTTGSMLRELKGHALRVRALAFSPDGSILVSGGDDQVLRIWDPQSGEELRALIGHSSPVMSLAFLADGTTIVSAATGDPARNDAVPRVWDLAARRRQAKRAGFESALRTLVGAPDDPAALVVCGGWYAENRVWDWSAGLSFRAARGVAANVDHLTLARSSWISGRLDEAKQHFQLEAGRQPSPDPYVTWCVQTMESLRP